MDSAALFGPDKIHKDFIHNKTEFIAAQELETNNDNNYKNNAIDYKDNSSNTVYNKKQMKSCRQKKDNSININNSNVNKMLIKIIISNAIMMLI